jgi:hypothetical protein
METQSPPSLFYIHLKISFDAIDSIWRCCYLPVMTNLRVSDFKRILFSEWGLYFMFFPLVILNPPPPRERFWLHGVSFWRCREMRARFYCIRVCFEAYFNIIIINLLDFKVLDENRRSKE